MHIHISAESCSNIRYPKIMADRVTQLQDAVNQLAEHFCNSIGVLQQCATPTKFPGFEKQQGAVPPPEPGQSQEEYTQLFAQLIARTAKDIEVLINSLPSEESTLELQQASLQHLEAENQEAAAKLAEVVTRGEALLARIQEALGDIADAQLRTQSAKNAKPTQEVPIKKEEGDQGATTT